LIPNFDFIRFKFDIVSIILILIATIILPFVSEIIGIIANLKYPKLDATNDTEIVKQSMSSMISVFAGMGLTALTIIVIAKLLIEGINRNMIMLILLVFYGLLGIVLFMYLVKTCDKSFNNINS
jgi:ABC-2 type transport system permease protein